MRTDDTFEAQRAERFTVLEQIGATFKDVPPEELEREVSKALSKVREEARQHSQRDARQP